MGRKPRRRAGVLKGRRAGGGAGKRHRPGREYAVRYGDSLEFVSTDPQKEGPRYRGLHDNMHSAVTRTAAMDGRSATRGREVCEAAP